MNFWLKLQLAFCGAVLGGVPGQVTEEFNFGHFFRFTVAKCLAISPGSCAGNSYGIKLAGTAGRWRACFLLPGREQDGGRSRKVRR
jgi:hypothetical protein